MMPYEPHPKAEAPAKCTGGGQGGMPLVEGDYLVSWALLMGLGGAESLPEGPGRPAAVAAVTEAAVGLPWLRASEGTLRVLRREEKLQEHS